MGLVPAEGCQLRVTFVEVISVACKSLGVVGLFWGMDDTELADEL